MIYIFEGPDGVGKTTLVNTLKGILEKQVPVAVFREPRNEYRERLFDPQTSLEERGRLFKESWQTTLREAVARIQEGAVVLVDRFTPSRSVYLKDEEPNTKETEEALEYLKTLGFPSIQFCFFYLLWHPRVLIKLPHTPRDHFEAMYTPDQLNQRYFESFNAHSLLKEVLAKCMYVDHTSKEHPEEEVEGYCKFISNIENVTRSQL